MKKIKLNSKKYPNLYALVDDEDFIILKNMKWYVSKQCGPSFRFYAYTFLNGSPKHMQRFLLNDPKGYLVDHKDGNSLNNQKMNLRVCTRAQNAHNSKMQISNTSGFKGVYFSKQKQKWHSIVKIQGRIKHLGFFDNKIEAAKAYDKGSLQYHGEFALNNKMMGLLN